MWTPSIASNMNFPTPLAVMGFLAACGGLVLGALAIITAIFIKKTRLAYLIAALAVAGTAVYLGLLLGFSLFSREKVLAHGREKYFCEIDCHLAYSVVEFMAVPAGDSTRYTILLRTRFDENTISPRLPKDAPLLPNSRDLRVVDGQGRQYPIIQSAGTPLTTSLISGQSYTTELQFSAPSGASSLRLLITSHDWPEHFLIGDELSPWHKKTWLTL
jgi:hypothetical protein